MTTQPSDSPTESSYALVVVPEQLPIATINCSECREITDQYAQEFTVEHRKMGPMWTLAIYICLTCGAHRVKKFAR